MDFKWSSPSGGIKGAWGKMPPSPSRRLCPPTCPSSQKEKNGQNQPFSANFWIFAPSESHFSTSMPPTKKFLVPPLSSPMQSCCNHCAASAILQSNSVLLVASVELNKLHSYSWQNSPGPKLSILTKSLVTARGYTQVPREKYFIRDEQFIDKINETTDLAWWRNPRFHERSHHIRDLVLLM